MEKENGTNYLPWRIDHRRCALLVIDMQNDFLKPGGALYVNDRSVQIVPRVNRIIAECRKLGIPVIYTQAQLKDEFDISPLEVSYQPLLREKGLRPGTWGYELIEEITPLPGEHIIVKHRYDAFYNTILELLLNNVRGLGVVDTVIIVGTLTNVCCESTARSAFIRDYKVVFISDANGTFDEAAHQATLNNIRRFFGRVLTTEELLTALNEGEEDRIPYIS